MENLIALQEKIERLLLVIRELKSECMTLEEENTQLIKKIESMHVAVENNVHDLHELSEEKNRTKMVLDDLIKSIDSFIGAEQ
jgi:predicted RNase H-like nuclease (RuvC/YqgF family)